MARKQNIDERKRRLLQLLSLLRLALLLHFYLHLEERHAQHDRHARLQRLLQTVVVIQHEHAERNVLPRYPSLSFPASTQHFIQRLQHQPRAREHSVRSQRLRLIPAVLTHEILVRRHQKLDVLAENHRGLLEERDAVGARAAGVHAGIVVRPAMQAEK